MLPPRLKGIKEQLESRSSHSKEERELLNELNALDSSRVISEELRKSIPQIVAGPSSKCPCCGR
jgi:hypothetical protein